MKNNEIKRRFVKLDYTNCCNVKEKSYYKIVGPSYIIDDKKLIYSLEGVLGEDLLYNGCSCCSADLVIFDDILELNEEERKSFYVKDIIDYTDTKVNISLEKDLMSIGINSTLKNLSDEVNELKEKDYDNSNIILELKDFNGVKISGNLCLVPEISENNDIILRGFVKEIKLPTEKSDTHVYCTDCTDGELLIQSLIENNKELKPSNCNSCYPYDVEDSIVFEKRPNYKGCNSKNISYEEYLRLRNIALKLIEEYHKDDVDKGGHPYINHLVRVSSGCKTYAGKIAGLLHDIIEDTNCTPDILLSNGIPQFIIDIILLVSRKEGETYNKFIDRLISSDDIYAMDLKCSDLRDNCDLSRLEHTDEETIKKGEKRILTRYLPSLLKIEKAINSI